MRGNWKKQLWWLNESGAIPFAQHRRCSVYQNLLGLAHSLSNGQGPAGESISRAWRNLVAIWENISSWTSTCSASGLVSTYQSRCPGLLLFERSLRKNFRSCFFSLYIHIIACMIIKVSLCSDIHPFSLLLWLEISHGRKIYTTWHTWVGFVK